MKRSEYKAARRRGYLKIYKSPADHAETLAEEDVVGQEDLDDFPGWDPEEPETFDEAVAPQRPEAEKAEEPEWYEWNDQGCRSRVSLSGTPSLEYWSSLHQEYRHASKASVADGWRDAIVAGVRLLAKERRLALGQVSLLRARDIAQQEEIRRLGAELTRTGDLYSGVLSGNNHARAEISRLQGEVQMAEAKVEAALGETAHWRARALLANGTEALYRESQNARAQLAGDVERLESEIVQLRAELQAARARAADALIGESLRQDHGPTPFSRDEWRYDFAGRCMASAVALDDTKTWGCYVQPAVQAADALLEALEASNEGEAGAEAREATKGPDREEGIWLK